MASLLRSRFVRGLLAFFFIVSALLVGWLAVSMLAEGANGHGSFAGNAFLIGFGVLLLVLTPIIFIVGIINWKKASQPDTQDLNK